MSQQQVVGIGFPIDYLGQNWTVLTITKQHVVLQAVGNPGRTTRVELKVFEQAIEDAKQPPKKKAA